MLTLWVSKDAGFYVDFKNTNFEYFETHIVQIVLLLQFQYQPTLLYNATKRKISFCRILKIFDPVETAH
jgi:hypothetical protein